MHESFNITVGIVMGILLPLLILVGAAMALLLLYGLIVKINMQLEKMRKAPPYDTVETTMSVIDKALHIRFIKNKKVIWNGKITEKEMTE